MKKGLFVLLTVLFPAVSLFSQESDEVPYFMADVKPEFVLPEGGDFVSWLSGNASYPEAALEAGIEGRVVISFVVEPDGSLGDIQILASPDETLGAEVARVAAGSPAWKPGAAADGTKLRVRHNVPIDFVIPEQETGPEPESEPVAEAEPEPEKQADYLIAPEFKTDRFGDFMEYLQENIKYPANQVKNKTKGMVEVNFDVDVDGAVRDVRLVKNPNALLSREVLDVLMRSPLWTPGLSADMVHVKVPMTVSVSFGSDGNKGVFTVYTPKTLQEVAEEKEKIRNISESRAKATESGLVPVNLVETPPVFPNGNFLSWVQKNTIYPSGQEQRKGGRVVYSFVIGTDGSIEDIKIITSPDAAFSTEVMRVLSSAPKWKPGTQKGEPVRVGNQGYVDFVL